MAEAKGWLVFVGWADTHLLLTYARTCQAAMQAYSYTLTSGPTVPRFENAPDRLGVPRLGAISVAWQHALWSIGEQGEDGERGWKKVEKDNDDFDLSGFAGIILPDTNERTGWHGCVCVIFVLRITNEALIALQYTSAHVARPHFLSTRPVDASHLSGHPQLAWSHRHT